MKSSKEICSAIVTWIVIALLCVPTADVEAQASAKPLNVLIAGCQNGERDACFLAARRMDDKTDAGTALTTEERTILLFGYENACKLELAKACWNLARSYVNSNAGPTSLEKARVYFAKACALGDKEGCSQEQRMKFAADLEFCSNADDRAKNAATEAQGERLLLTRMDSDFCVYFLGLLEERRRNYEKAMRLFQMAAKMGNNPYAVNDIGRFYSEGKSVSVDLNKALTWYHKALDILQTADFHQFPRDSRFISAVKDNIRLAETNLRNTNDAAAPTVHQQTCHVVVDSYNPSGQSLTHLECN